MTIQKRIAPLAFRPSLYGLTPPDIKDAEAEIEAAQQFHIPLMHQRLRHQDQDPVSPSGQMQPVQNQAGFDRLSQPHFICEEHPGAQSSGYLGGNTQLVWNQFHPCSGKPADH